LLTGGELGCQIVGVVGEANVVQRNAALPRVILLELKAFAHPYQQGACGILSVNNIDGSLDANRDQICLDLWDILRALATTLS
jgi:hypothetical protein